MPETHRLFGTSIKRREDPRFITGKGNYVDDVKLPGTTYAAFVRSPHGHARIRAIDIAPAMKLNGVFAVFTGKDLVDGGVKSLPVGWLLPNIKIPQHLPLAVDRARYMGDAVAVVIAETPYLARDAAELVEVDYEPLPAAVEGARAIQPGAPAGHDEVPDNVCFRWSIGDKDKTDAAFRGAARVVKQSFINHRLIPNAIEPRAALANPSVTGDVTLWMTSQNPHVHRLIMSAFVLGIPEHKLRVISPDVGGGFGSKIFVYPEECVVTWAAKALSRPVKWVAERRESFQTDAHGRDHQTEAEMALDAGGRILGLRVRTVANLGAYLSTFAPSIPTYLYGTLMAGAYQTPAIYVEVTGAFTNTTPVDAYRGAGRPEATYVVERMVDLAARELSMDPVELRRKNFIPREKFPYQTPVALTYESATVRVTPTGKVTVFTGSHSHGQGHETTFAQVVADELGLPVEDVEIVHGDTGQVPFGMGTYGSRSGPVGASAVYQSVQKVKDKAKKIAAHLLEASESDVTFEEGKFFVKGSPDRAKGWGDVALMAYLAHNMPKGLEPGLEAISFFDPPNFVFPFGTHIAVVEVERDTGQVKLLRYVAVDDLGKVINPMIVDGMVHGGIAQGVSQALWEHAEYDENGQLLTGSFMNYAMPHADDLPSFEVGRTETPSPVNPLGVKGAGETGTIASTAAVANAVMDALSPFGIKHLDMPLTPARVWEAMQA